MLREKLIQIYDLLLDCFGPQNWWPGDTPFEIMVGAILTQNTSWANVEKAIVHLKTADLLSPENLHSLHVEELAGLIRPAGYYNIKARRLQAFTGWLVENHDGEPAALENVNTAQLRMELLEIKGIGLETADSILLYALNRPIFVVDAYTARIAVRHQLIEPEADYERLQELFQANLPEDVQLFNEYHALLVRLGKEYCKRRARCAGCPLEILPHTVDDEP